MLVQMEDYASGQAVDPFLRAALKPAEELTQEERSFILQVFLSCESGRLIYRYPRYGELYYALARRGTQSERLSPVHHGRPARPAGAFATGMVRRRSSWRRTRRSLRWWRRGAGTACAIRLCSAKKQTAAMARVMPTYRAFAERGQIEISTTPFYHPILPLLCDSNIASESHPYVPLPSQFRYPDDAREQLERASRYMQERFGAAPAGLWPSEGSVSDEALSLAAETGLSGLPPTTACSRARWIAMRLRRSPIVRIFGHRTASSCICCSAIMP